MAKRYWSDQQLETAVKQSKNISSVLRLLGYGPTGNITYLIKKHINRLNLSTDHFRKGSTTNKKIENCSLFIENCKTNWSVVRKRLKKDNLLDFSKCSLCNISTWIKDNKDVPLTLHIDHKNGVNNDNRLENLRVICPNCHSLTDTFCGKNIRKRRLFSVCSTCFKSINSTDKRCKQCSKEYLKKSTNTVFPWPDNDTLIQSIKGLTSFKAAQKLGCSVNGLIQHLKKRGILSNFNQSKEGLPHVHFSKPVPSKEDLIATLCKFNYTQTSNHYKVSRTLLRKWCRKYKICKEDVNRVKKNHRSVYVPIGKSSCPSKEVLQDLLWKYPATAIAKMFSVSDKAISKWAKKYNLSKPGVGYWAKQYSISGRQKDIGESV